ncbi:MAG TPA: M42 family metallopeptidase [Fimbriimonadaceae bacterium]|nr:M42 family metallopeptidase [Fimbriimonadaceae bacterium]HRJ32450.1 M42 family metallopeptidase [Fimbriimonadaceae bacterium]
MARFAISPEYIERFLVDLLNSPSPTGDTEWAISFVEQELQSFGLQTHRTLKGALVAQIPGIQNDAPRAITAHVDTLGAVVAEIKGNGRLRLSALNGVNWPSVESEGVWIPTRSGSQIRGSIVLTNGAVHVNKEATSAPRNADTLEVRLDERTETAEQTRMLGIEVGDFVYFDPRVEVTSGFIRSRFLDDKACVACVVAALKAITEAGVSPAQDTTILISNYEEVGHGGTDGLPENITELVVADMACIGHGLRGDEFHCSICIKDSSGPYSRRLTEKLRTVAEQQGIDLKPDIYPYYGSDGSAYWRAGGRAEVALIGPGVDTSHGYERTHIDALVDTTVLMAEYLFES